MGKRVVITGIGVVSPIGIGVDAYFEALKNGKNGVDLITDFDTTDFGVKFAAQVKDFVAENYMDKKEARRADRVIQFACAASDMALADSGLDKATINPDRFAVYLASGIGGIDTCEAGIKALALKGPSRVGPFTVPMMIASMPAAYVAIRHDAKGANMGIVTACASSLHACAECFYAIERGDADVAFVGGAESTISDFGLSAFGNMKALSTRNDDCHTASRPFDKDRDGFVLGEGACVFVFEELEHAKARGAKIYAEVKGFGLTCDAYHITAPAPDGEGAIKAMRLACERAGWEPSTIDLVNAHGTSTSFNDRTETHAVHALMGEAAKNVYVQATKSMIGHSLGAAGALGAAAAIMAIKDGIVHPTINYTTPDPECDLNYVPNKYIEATVKRVLVNAFGFGGQNAVMALEKYGDN